jgi:hypothetical protein
MSSPVVAGHEPISPELVLVDLTLRRVVLQYPPAELPRWAAQPTASVSAALPASRRSSWRSQVLVAAAAAAVTAAIVIVPAGASPTPSTPRSVVAPAHALPRTFVWVASPGATAYRFALYRGSKVVFEATTSEHQLTLPGSWRQQGELRTLRPGHYRWYVWALNRTDARLKGKRTLVQATLEVPES